jgi:hypothetical protein
MKMVKYYGELERIEKETVLFKCSIRGIWLQQLNKITVRSRYLLSHLSRSLRKSDWKLVVENEKCCFG